MAETRPSISLIVRSALYQSFSGLIRCLPVREVLTMSENPKDLAPLDASGPLD